MVLVEYLLKGGFLATGGSFQQIHKGYYRKASKRIGPFVI
jgi:hypothetical protein